MTAQEFIKQYGWEISTRLQREMQGITEQVADSISVWGQSEWDELKQLVEAWELIENFGGLFSLVCTIDKECPCPEFGQLEYYDENRSIVLVDMPKIEQAIELVESVNA